MRWGDYLYISIGIISFCCSIIAIILSIIHSKQIKEQQQTRKEELSTDSFTEVHLIAPIKLYSYFAKLEDNDMVTIECRNEEGEVKFREELPFEYYQKKFFIPKAEGIMRMGENG